MSITQWLRTPKGYVMISMMTFLLTTAALSQDLKGILNSILAVGVSVTADFIGTSLSGKKRTFPDSAIISGLIISLILSTSTSWYAVAATAFLTIASKYVFVYKKKPIFNPAAFGLLLSILLFRTGQSWWGSFGDLPSWTNVFLLIGGYMITSRVNKFPMVFSFLATYFLLLLIMGFFHIGDASDALRSPFINATLFFAFFMLTDPPTTPAKDKEQFIFGILSAVMGAVVYGIFGGLMYLFIGLLVGNLYQYMVKRVTAASKTSGLSS